MKNIKFKISIVFGLLFLQTPVFCRDVVQAVDELKAAVQDGSDPSSIRSMLNKIFIMDGTGAQQATLDKKIDLYAQNFYKLYSIDQDFVSNKVKKTNDTPLIDSNISDLLSINEKTKAGAESLLMQDIYYATQRNVEDKIKDKYALMMVPSESGANNIYPKAMIDNNLTMADAAKGGSPYGSLDDSNKQSDPKTRDVLSVSALIGPDGYSVKDKEADDARLFINQLAQGSPLPKVFYIPDAKGKDSVPIYLPYADQANNTPYTKIQISTKGPVIGNSEYANMVDTLNKSSVYREYKMKVRSRLALRSLYFDSIFRIFQERYKANDKDKSLVEKERDMAQVGLTQEYYNNLKTKSVADVNLETLYTLNKVVYFLHKLHQDNERTQLAVAISGMQVQPLDTQDEATYIKPIGALIENKCWDLSLAEVPSGKTQEERKEICPVN
jgi:hypothetical protein